MMLLHDTVGQVVWLGHNRVDGIDLVEHLGQRVGQRLADEVPGADHDASALDGAVECHPKSWYVLGSKLILAEELVEPALDSTQVTEQLAHRCAVDVRQKRLGDRADSCE